MPESKTIYRISFHNQGKAYEIYARQVSQGNLFGFIEIEELVFGEHSKLLVDPADEKLRSEFSGVKRSHIPLHSVIRIDEVEKEGAAKIHDMDNSGGNVTVLPTPFYSPPTK